MSKDEEIDYRELINRLDNYLLTSPNYTQEEREEIVESLANNWIKRGLLI